MISYKAYCEGIKKFGGEVLISEEEYNTNYCTPKDDYVATIKSTSNKYRPAKATLSGCEDVIKRPKPKAAKIPKPAKVKAIKPPKEPKPKKEPRPRKTAEEIAQNKRERQLRWYYNKKGLPIPETARNRVLRKDMTPEQLKEHVSKLASSRRIRKKENGTLPALTEQQLETKRRNNVNWYLRNKDCPKFKARQMETQRIRRAKAKLKKEEEKQCLTK